MDATLERQHQAAKMRGAIDGFTSEILPTLQESCLQWYGIDNSCRTYLEATRAALVQLEKLATEYEQGDDTAEPRFIRLLQAILESTADVLKVQDGKTLPNLVVNVSEDILKDAENKIIKPIKKTASTLAWIAGGFGLFTVVANIKKILKFFNGESK